MLFSFPLFQTSPKYHYLMAYSQETVMTSQEKKYIKLYFFPI